jgi:hypothetical protein
MRICSTKLMLATWLNMVGGVTTYVLGTPENDHAFEQAGAGTACAHEQV